MTETFISKLSKTRAGERSRIWIEGKRLAAVGFKVGEYFSRDWQDKKLVLTVIPPAKWEDLTIPERGTVSGKGDKPIIDITGRNVFEAFGKGSHVNVEYKPGKITITRA